METSSTKLDVFINYDSKMKAVDSKYSGSFSLRFKTIVRFLVRNPSGRETLVEQKIKPRELVSETEIPPFFLAEEETCCQYIASVLSKKTNIHSWIQGRIVPDISKDMIETSRLLEEKEGFLVEAEVEVVKEMVLLSINVNELESLRIQTEHDDCTICLEELLVGQREIMKLHCSHIFHEDCIIMWMRHNRSCPICRQNVV
ncbi:E3 ubiquitin-protein ligase SIS3 [Cardamine amara subsp. amara]|uniref:RING-type E3 ubiquitin transferase n=1 Tax=Cardamine amara subsp. amara TaxID=228776 RepID=A0ABD1A997_CARAN